MTEEEKKTYEIIDVKFIVCIPDDKFPVFVKLLDYYTSMYLVRVTTKEEREAMAEELKNKGMDAIVMYNGLLKKLCDTIVICDEEKVLSIFTTEALENFFITPAKKICLIAHGPTEDGKSAKHAFCSIRKLDEGFSLTIFDTCLMHALTDRVIGIF